MIFVFGDGWIFLNNLLEADVIWQINNLTVREITYQQLASTFEPSDTSIGSIVTHPARSKDERELLALAAQNGHQARLIYR